MEGSFLDTNIFLRHLLDDHPEHSTHAHHLFQAIERREVVGWTSPLVVAEIVYILSNHKTYDIPRAEIREQLMPLLSVPGVQLERKRLYHRVFELYTSLTIDFIDCYHAAMIESYGQGSLYSFDPDFDAVPSVARFEP
jgi:predicted nucleic acid-binding protein